MRKIAIVTAGLLPVPAVNGGAVESLIDFLIKENEIADKLEITVFSTYNEKATREALTFNNTKVEFVRVNDFINKTYKLFVRIINKLFSMKINYNKLYIYNVCKYIRNKEFDHIIIENSIDYVLSIKKRTNAPISLHIHNDYLNNSTNKSDKIINNCFKVITVSEFLKNRVLSLGNQYNEKVSVLKNCTDVNIFNKSLYTEFRNSFRSKNNINENEIIIMYSGRIDPTKGIKELIMAFKKIKYINCKLLIVGGSWYGVNTETLYTKEIEELSQDIRDRIIFTGFVPFMDMPKIHAVADIAIVPSIWEEPAGLVVLEAMASGLPLIVTNSGGIREYISEKSVVMVERNENLVKNLTNSMEELIINGKKRETLSISAREHSLQYNTKQYYDQFIKIIEVENGK